MKRKIAAIIGAILASVVILISGFFVYLKYNTNTEFRITEIKDNFEYIKAAEIYKNIVVEDTLMSGVIEYAHNSLLVRLVKAEKRNAVIFFSAVGCTGCDEQYPYFKKVAKEYKGRYMFLMNKCQMGNQKFQKERFLYIDVFPRTIVFKDGKECKRFSNPIEMEDWLKEKGEQY